MHQPLRHHRAGLVLLAVSVAACAGARGVAHRDGSAEGQAATAAPLAAAPGATPSASLASTDVLPPTPSALAPAEAPEATGSTGGSDSASISTGDAEQLLTTVDDLLRQLDTELVAHDDALDNEGE
jgi:hypothetical protein